jgi:serine/threonine protein kinase/Flp pilus assembly protein TadD
MATGPDETRLMDLLARWEELRRQGREVTIDALCADCPELAGRLAERAAFLRGMSALDVGSTDSFPSPPDGPPTALIPGPLPDSLRATAVYEPTRRHAMGGQGEVLVARHQELDRLVALKRIRPDRIHEHARRRFLREAAITARLQHPGIVPVYATGQDRDGPFYTMPLVEGQTLQEAIAAFHGDEALRRDPGRGSLKFRGLLQRFIAVCETIAYAHDQGITHRDLKPSNIILGAYGETLVMDWGLAKSFKGDRTGPETDGDAPSPSPSPDALTATGAVLGTPRYMSPEQARGEPAGPASDVFSLGLVLYEVLTGRPVFDSDSFRGPDPLRAVREVAITPPRKHDARLSPALEAVCVKALAADPANRYPTARALGADIERWLADEPVSAWREPPWIRARRWMRRHRTAVSAGAAAAFSVIVFGAGVAIWLSELRHKEAARTSTLIGEARLLLNIALQAPDDESRWLAAMEAVRRVEVAMGDAADPEMVRAKAALDSAARLGLRRAESYRRLQEVLVDIRSAEADDPTGTSTAARYAEAFRSAGIDVDAMDPAEAGAMIRALPTSVEKRLIAALDDWVLGRRLGGVRAKGPKLIAIAREADPDPTRDELRAAFLEDDADKKLGLLRPLASRADTETWSPDTFVLLAWGLTQAGAIDEGLSVLRRAAAAFPSDLWVHYELGRLSESTRPARLNDAIRAYSVARALQPETAHELAHRLEATGRVEEASQVFRDLVRRRPDNCRHLVCFGRLLKAQEKGSEANIVLERAVEAGRTSVALQPDDAITFSNVGIALEALGRPDEAVAACREAIRVDPAYAAAYSNLGNALVSQGRPEEAETAYREAVRIDPSLAPAHVNHGLVLNKLRRHEEAVAAFREAVRFQPDLAEAHLNLGYTLEIVGRHEESAAACRAAIRLRPDLAGAHHNLGNALASQGLREEAIASFRKAIELRPRLAEAHCNLGHQLRKSGRYAEALEALRKGHELGSARPDWGYESAEWVRRCERLMALEARLPAVLNGDEKPRDDEEVLEFVGVCSDKGLHAAGARLWANEFAVDPGRLASPRTRGRYNAACSAALAAAGKSQDDPPPDEAARTGLRTQALAWLKVELTNLTSLLVSEGTRARAVIQRQLSHWKSDPDLAGFRDVPELARLPEAERDAWRSLWSEIDDLLAKATDRK